MQGQPLRQEVRPIRYVAVIPASGEQVQLSRGDLSATVTEVGATLRTLRWLGEPVLWELSADEIAVDANGQVLAPWPNRLEDGTYRYRDVDGRAALDEPELSNAIHGLVRWVEWTIEDRSVDRARFSYVLHPQPAYPFRLRLEVEYALDDNGITITFAASNTGPTVAPFGLGFHPYLLGGPEGINEAVVELPAERRLVLDERALPLGEEDTLDTAFDLRCRAIGDLILDDCFTQIASDGNGRWHAVVRTPGRRSELWADAAFSFAMCYTGDTLERSADRRRAIAIEPMTCPPNALRTGVGLLDLEPGSTWRASWGIAVTKPY